MPGILIGFPLAPLLHAKLYGNVPPFAVADNVNGVLIQTLLSFSGTTTGPGPDITVV